MKSNEYKKHDRNTCAWDLNAGCRAFTANTKSRRKLRKRLRKALRKKIERIESYDD